MGINVIGELKGTITAPAQLRGTIEQLNVLTGIINTSSNEVYSGKLKAVISDTVSLVGKITNTEVLKGNLTIPQSTGEVVIYDGDYEVTPRVESQTLNTRSKAMRDDLTILAIPYYETSNPTGKTVYIGGG